ncbi:cytochrome C [Ideonella sp.]|uniref:cytochrome C n=1 Tax=Ideonella sp. TaxID=1929293 RepID=UPI002B4683A3|nr:cytochrome C [Ideonella sp.]HJV72255.1 cytochrome C [Ideonella sp.]
MNTRLPPSFAGAALAALIALAITGPARADDHGPRVAPPPAYLQECGACHVPFPARGLPAASWRRLMANLPHHFGTDASLDPAAERDLGAWLQAQAGSPSRVAEPPQDRLTRSTWFVREHDEVPAGLWRSAAVGKASNCAACHTRAAEGRFGEHEIRLPR